MRPTARVGSRCVPGLGAGGGMYNHYSSSPTLTDCTFSGNSASLGGGMYNNYYSGPAA